MVDLSIFATTGASVLGPIFPGDFLRALSRRYRRVSASVSDCLFSIKRFGLGFPPLGVDWGGSMPSKSPVLSPRTTILDQAIKDAVSVALLVSDMPTS